MTEPAKLTDVELGVLIAAARGLTARQTAADGSAGPMTRETVRSIRKRICDKTGTPNMVAALAVAVARGELVISDGGEVGLPSDA